ncbi:MAG: single-stranded-DNA-specific exonuclease RecJ [Myxococcaceae bacterium]|nr:single-stranded-DNA-specific exonuclease RecJ [Myxococcaceae bacterium]
MKWITPQDVPAGKAKTLCKELGVHPLAAQILIHRGYDTPPAAQEFLSDALSGLPDPFLMKGLPTAVDRLERAVLKGEKITLYGDYDVDGVCSTTLLSLFLRELAGAQVATYIPHRLGEGYGLNKGALARIAGDGTQLLVTLDCGITSHAEIAHAKALGLEVIVVDHHAVPETMPTALAVLNPLQPGCDYPTKWLCAAGVAFNLCMGLRKHLREKGFFATQAEPNLKAYLDLVAMATVADVVPLLGANRLLVKHGLKELTRAARPGVRALKEVAGLGAHGTVTAGQVGFRLGPRINAAGRLDDASVGMRMLAATDEKEAMVFARQLDAANAERQAIEKSILDEALMLGAKAVKRGAKGLVLSSEKWHPGVIGIVASRVVERYHRPTVMIGVYEGVGRGSARSIEGFHLHDALKRCEQHLTKFGGHKYAAGLSVAPDDIPLLTAKFEHVAGAILTDEDMVARCRIDAWVRPEALNLATVEALSALAPFGSGNPEPVLASSKVRAAPRLLNNKQTGEPEHLKLSIEKAPELDVIGFRLADRAGLAYNEIDMAYQVSIDEWNGRQRVQLKLKDVRAPEPDIKITTLFDEVLIEAPLR